MTRSTFGYSPVFLLVSVCGFALSPFSVAPPVAAQTASVQAKVTENSPLRIDVDARDVQRGLFHVTETVPVVQPGILRLRYPEWLPGKHSSSGKIANLTGFEFSANGQTLSWKRDPLDVFSILVDVPDGVSALTAKFVYLAPLEADQGRVTVAPEMLSMGWHEVSLYPAGHPVRDIQVYPSLRLPQGWQQASALEPMEGSAPDRIHFKPVSYETLVDSPLVAGSHYRQVDLGSDVYLDLFGDEADNLKATEEQLDLHRDLVTQSLKLFGVRHFDHYDFLVSMSDFLGGIGLEHHRSSEDGVSPDYFTDWDKRLLDRYLLPHEFVHSWNGKYRRGEDLATPDYHEPMQDSLLWVYEGQTQFWGNILAARSGLVSKQDALDMLATTAASYDRKAGRNWRPVIDTTNDPIMAHRRPAPWPSWQRSEDYYIEGMLTWLDADMLIRKNTRGKKSLDDFARLFFGGKDGDWSLNTYRREDVVAALNTIYPYDWDSFLKHRIDDIAPHAPLDWITEGGYKLTFNDTPNSYIKARQSNYKMADFSYSLGLAISNGGEVSQVYWGSPAFDAKLTPGVTIVGVDGREYSSDAMKKALDRSAESDEPIHLTVKRTGRVWNVEIAYHGGQLYPHLERVKGTPARLDDLLAPLK
ncbi:M61 family peptidase [Altericroceibacterium spongiae]|uniref:M61 family peptidase n=1 Tax=Altericroceibacterium spongiae TaxID=2320269 RepID=A0A420ECE3_9SPHN|nr:M61 family metallopeptidase [Altericroceibacterium spongiae]RKF18341.1 M61 family peptidase [Altericroceibacterium spongiae]